ncbi:MAG: glycosyltransferase family 4 protein [Candidatus Pacearchaeota archaeon]
MKKVLFLSPLPPPNYGSALSSQMCLSILRKNNYDTNTIKLNFAKEMSEIGKINYSKFSQFLRIKRQLQNYFKKEKPDLIYMVPATYGLGLLREYFIFKIIKRNNKEKILFHMRSRMTEENWRNPIYRFVYKKMFKDQKAIVLDDSLKGDLHNLVSKENLFVLPNAIKNEVTDTKIKKTINKRKKRRTFNLLFLSHMDETKGWCQLLSVCKILKGEGIDFKCNFVGDWPSNKEKTKFEDFVKINSLEKNVKYLGPKFGKEKDTVMEDSDVLIYPSTLDTFGRVIIECMMWGLPVIANGVGAIPATVKHNKTGFVLKENSPEEIVAYVKKLRNKNLRIKMGRLGRKRFLEEYEIGEYEKKFLKIINSNN